MIAHPTEPNAGTGAILRGKCEYVLVGWRANLCCRHAIARRDFSIRRWPRLMKIFALVVLSILAGVILLVGSSYLDIYFRLFEASLSLRPVTTLSLVLAVALLLWLGPRRFRPGR
jgi:hypothetical protein